VSRVARKGEASQDYLIFCNKVNSSGSLPVGKMPTLLTIPFLQNIL
jgi:hypothetical protein